MTTKVKVIAEQVHDGKHVTVSLEGSNTGSVVARLKQGEFAELWVHSGANAVVREVDGEVPTE